MKIQKIDLSKLHNEEHYQLLTDFKTLVNQYTPVSMGIEIQFEEFLKLYIDEIVALNSVRKSAATDDLDVSDCIRNSTLRGLNDTVKAALNHYKPEIKQAAYHVHKVFKHYNKLTFLSFDEETAAINRLVADLKGVYASDAAIVGITDWVTELKKHNDSFDHLKRKHYPEESSKIHIRMKEIRAALDVMYYSITEFINALILVNGESNYTGFVNEMNQHIENFKIIYSQCKERNTEITNGKIIEVL